jgi:hypothetical protein
VLAATGLLVIPAAAQPSTNAGSKIEKSLATELSVDGSADFYVEFAEQADLSTASRIADWDQRGAAVVAALRRTADASQSDVRKQLALSGTSYQPFWVANTVLVRSGSDSLAQTLASFGNVTRLRSAHTYSLPAPSPGTVENEINAVEWGIARIRADQVWSTFGVRGEGITVANVDTGVDFDHPALVDKYRGNTGGGTYDVRLLLGTYTIEVSKTNYVTNGGSVTLSSDGQVVTRDVALATARAEVTPGSLSFLGNAGQLRSAPVTVRNMSTSGVPLTYAVDDDASWMWVVPGSGTVAPGAAQTLTVRADPTGLAPGVYTGTVRLTTNAGRQPVIDIPVTLVVPAYRQGVNTGGGAFTDTAGDPWAADKAYAAGSYGYVGAGAVTSVKKAIAGTNDDALYQDQREGTSGYRFDNLPAGTYVVDLDFAELRSGLPTGRRVFTVSINGAVVLPNYDIAAAVGSMTADRRVFQVAVPAGGSITVGLAAAPSSSLPPAINAVRVTHRPDL